MASLTHIEHGRKKKGFGGSGFAAASKPPLFSPTIQLQGGAREEMRPLPPIIRDDQCQSIPAPVVFPVPVTGQVRPG
jgi:hypothetical protein